MKEKNREKIRKPKNDLATRNSSLLASKAPYLLSGFYISPGPQAQEKRMKYIGPT